jgi:hypothetical protein
MLSRDGESLSWRFDRRQGRSYRYIAHDDGSGCNGLAVVTSRSLLDRPVLLLVDLMVSNWDDEVAGRLLRTAVNLAADDGLSAVVAFFTPLPGPSRALRKNGFWRIPGAFQPRGYAVWAAMDLEGSARARATFLPNWHMSLADSDLA